MFENAIDGKKRCFGNKSGQEFYAKYHDEEWGIPVHDDRLLFEMLILEGAQAGLSWETVLKKRAAYRVAFHNFVAEKLAAISDAELEMQMHNSQIIRNRLKIFSVRKNARIFLEIQKEFGSFDKYLWRFVDFLPIKGKWEKFGDVPIKTKESDALSRDLKKRGMTFVGSTIIYAYMQAIGMVNDHLQECFCNRM
jgi:DNA-3-methyladenine glycosylase I